jgi:hypothetical protein
MYSYTKLPSKYFERETPRMKMTLNPGFPKCQTMGSGKSRESTGYCSTNKPKLKAKGDTKVGSFDRALIKGTL